MMKLGAISIGDGRSEVLKAVRPNSCLWNITNQDRAWQAVAHANVRPARRITIHI